MYTYEYRFPFITVGIFRLVILITITYLLQIIATFFYQHSFENLILFSNQFSIVSFFTYFFAFPVSLTGFISLVFDVLILWGFGSELERIWGSKNFYQYFFVSIYGAAVFLILVGQLLSNLVAFGLQAGIVGVLLAYAILWPNREVLFFMVIPIKIKWVVLIIFLFTALSSLSFFILSIGSLLSGSIYLYYIIKRGKIFSYQNISNPFQTTQNFDLESSKKVSFFSKIKNKFLEYQKRIRLNKKKQEILKRIEMKEELDRILEKISKEGMQSLTKEEKKFLDKASQEL